MENNNKLDQTTPEERQFAETALILTTWNTQWRTDHVRYLACEAKRSEGRIGDPARCPLGYINGWALNLLRHKYTNYDRLLKEFGRVSPYVARRLKERICAKALKIWPDLADVSTDEKWARKAKSRTTMCGNRKRRCNDVSASKK